MEFGAFDDDLFPENEKKPKIATPVNYKPKTLTPQWYMYTEEQAVPEDDPDKAYFYVYRGNHHYYHGEWSCALEAYTRVLDLITPNNTSMRRLLLESIARCRWRCEEAHLAVEVGKKLVEESTNDHQRFTAHSSLALFCHAAGDIAGQAKSLRCCLDLRPLSVQHWIQLAKIYLKQNPSTGCKNVPTAGEKDLEVKKHNGHSNDNQSQGSGNSHCTIQRTKDYSAKIESRPSATKDPTSHNGILTSNGLDEPRDVISEDSLHKEKGSLSDTQVAHQQVGIGKNLDPHSGSVRGEACESGHSNCKSSTVKEEPIKLEPSPTASENAPRQSSSSAAGQEREVLEAGNMERLCLSYVAIAAAKESRPSPAASKNAPRRSSSTAVGQDVEVLEADNLERLSRSNECIAAAKELEPSGLVVDIDGDGDRYGEGDFEMEAVICLLKARVILKSLQICAVSLTKIRNAQLLAEIEGLLSTLNLDPDFVQDMSKKTYNEVFEKEIKQGTALC